MRQSLNHEKKKLSDNTSRLVLNSLLDCFFISEEENTISSFAEEDEPWMCPWTCSEVFIRIFV